MRLARHRPPAVRDLRTLGPRDTTPRTAAARAWRALKRALIGPPLASTEAARERLTKTKALAVLSSDALSSVAYATEQTLLVLATAGAAALRLNWGIAAAIAALLAIVTLSYRQTIAAYPSGGGSYIVASQNLGELPGLTAAAALLIDYVLTVAVSISSGVAALTSAAPALARHHVALCLACVALITVVNLRGIRASGTIFAAPTYLFIASILGVVAVGLARVYALHDAAATFVPRDPVPGGAPLTALLVLRAFASGCTAMTGVEAISNGVPAFQPPEARNAQATMVWMSGTLGAMFLGITVLARAYGLVPRPDQTLLSQLARATVGGGAFYYVVQAATLAVLVLAANTSYADFPRLGSILARDGYAPPQFAFRGDRLAFSVGILVLAGLATLLLLVFKGDTSALIPLYAVGVFVSFTLSQAGMVRHWWRARDRESAWPLHAAINGLGATLTALVAVIAGATKFFSGEPLFRVFGFSVRAGSWIVLALIPALIALFRALHGHYVRAASAVATETPLDPSAIRHTVLVPIAHLDRVALQTLAYACSLEGSVTAVHIATDEATVDALRERWRSRAERHPFLAAVELVIIESPYRSLAGPLLAYIDEVDAVDPTDTLTVILPELVPSHWWELPLHNQLAFRLKAALLFRPGTVVTSVPYHLRAAR